MSDKILKKSKSKSLEKFKNKNLYNLIFKLDYDKVLNFCKNNESICEDDTFWHQLLQNYNYEFYEFIKEYNFNTKELYLDFLQIEKDEKHDLLISFIEGDYTNIN